MLQVTGADIDSIVARFYQRGIVVTHVRMTVSQYIDFTYAFASPYQPIAPILDNRKILFRTTVALVEIEVVPD